MKIKSGAVVSFFLTGLIIFYVTFSLPVSAGSFSETAGVSEKRIERLTKALNGYVEEKKIAGGVLLVMRGGKSVYHKAFGWRDKESKSLMHKDSLFRIASQTKALTSVAIMILQERGQLLITDPVSKYLKEYARTTVAEEDGKGGYNVVAAKREITIRDLLTHVAGISYGRGLASKRWKDAGIYGWYWADRKEPMRDVIARIATLPQKSQPGEAFVYGYSTDILGMVIQVVTGQTLERFLQDNITNPLGMKDTYFFVPKGQEDRLSVVYSSAANGIQRAASPGKLIGRDYIGQGHYVVGPRSAFSGGAGLISTAEDYGLFLQMLLNGGTLKGTRILSRKSVELMTMNQLPRSVSVLPGVGFGLGFAVVTDVGLRGVIGSKGEYGWGGAYHSVYWVDPVEDLVVVYLTQTLPAINLDDREKVRVLIYQAIVD